MYGFHYPSNVDRREISVINQVKLSYYVVLITFIVVLADLEAFAPLVTTHFSLTGASPEFCKAGVTMC